MNGNSAARGAAMLVDRGPGGARRFDDWRGSGAAVAPEDLHDAIFAGKLGLLDPLALDLFLRRQIVLVVEGSELLFELEVLLVELPELQIRSSRVRINSSSCFSIARSPRGCVGCSPGPSPCQFSLRLSMDTGTDTFSPRFHLGFRTATIARFQIVRSAAPPTASRSAKAGDNHAARRAFGQTQTGYARDRRPSITDTSTPSPTRVFGHPYQTLQCDGDSPTAAAISSTTSPHHR